MTEITLMPSLDQNELEGNLRKIEQKDLQDQVFFLCNDASFIKKRKKQKIQRAENKV